MVKFFLVVRQSPSYGLAVLAAVTVLGLLTTALDAAELDSALGMLLFVQMFLASSGFAMTARRGHFDPLLVHGRERTAVLFVQWCASVFPGAVAWTILAAAGYAWSSPAAASALAGTRLAAFVIVSAVAWVAGFRLPRGAGGAVWMGLLLALLFRRIDLLPPAVAQPSLLADLRAVGAFIACPFLLLGGRAAPGPSLAWASAAVAVSLLLIVIRMGSRLDVFLVERS